MRSIRPANCGRLGAAHLANRGRFGVHFEDDTPTAVPRLPEARIWYRGVAQARDRWQHHTSRDSELGARSEAQTADQPGAAVES